MATKTGKMSGGGYYFISVQYTGVSMGESEYPSGNITMKGRFVSRAEPAYVSHGEERIVSGEFLMCDKTGKVYGVLGRITLMPQQSIYTTLQKNITAKGLKGEDIYVRFTGNFPEYISTIGEVEFSVDYAVDECTITCTTDGNGTLKANKAKAKQGETITLTPSANADYQFWIYESNEVSVSANNTFTMPGENVTVKAKFIRKTYNVVTQPNKEGAGLVTASPVLGQSGTEVTLSQTPNTGYYFAGYTSSPEVEIDADGKFKIPKQEITITGNYNRRSTASLDKTTFDAGDTVVLTVDTEDLNYTHKYKLSFGTGMETEWVQMEEKTVAATITIPTAWIDLLTNAESKTLGELYLETYDGTTKIGDYTVPGLTFTVPTNIVPTINPLTTSIARTIGDVTYANVGDYYIVYHCGVRTQTSATGARGSTIASLELKMEGYNGNKYNKTQSGSSIDFTSGLLSFTGTQKITVTATDSRGRKATASATITVIPYTNPSGTLEVWRVDISGNTDPSGQYAKYELTKQFTEIGTNALTVRLSGVGWSGTGIPDTGDILPNDKVVFPTTQEFDITLTLTDAFETVTVVRKLPSAKFILLINADGDKIGFMKAPTKTIPAGKDSNVEFSADSQIWIGDETLEEFIVRIASGQ